jgi:4-oxalocrotonate tautomerase
VQEVTKSDSFTSNFPEDGTGEEIGGVPMPNITIQWYAGRTQDQKRQLTAAITDAMVKIGKTTPDQVHIVFQDVEKTDWGWNGKLASD